LQRLLSKNGDLHDTKKIVIWFAFTAEGQRIAQMLSQIDVTFVSFFGRMSGEERKQSRLRFMKDPSVRVFLGQVDRGMGMNELIVSNTSIYYSNSQKVESRLQSERRIRRKGSEVHEKIFYIDLISEHTIDGKVVAAVQKARNIAMDILCGLKQGRSLEEVIV
jgi:hypothetical protein